MLENTRQIIATKNQLKHTTDHHHKLTKDFEDHKDKALKGTPPSPSCRCPTPHRP